MTWEPLTRESQAATQQTIRDLLGIGEATFHHSVFAAQGARHFADADLTPKERMEVLADGLALDAWEEFRDACAADRRGVEAEHDALRMRLETWRVELGMREMADRRLAETQGDVEIYTGNLEFARNLHAQADAAFHAAKESRAGYDAAYREVMACQTAIHAIERERAAKRNQAAQRKAELERERDRHEGRAATYEREGNAFLARSLERARDAARLRDEGGGICDRCNQAVRGESLESTVASIVAEAQTLADEGNRLVDEYAKEKATAAQYQAEIDASPADTDDPETAAKQAAAELALRDATSRMSGMQDTAADDETMLSLERDVASARAEVDRCERELAAAHSAHGEAKERLRALNETAENYNSAAAKLSELEYELAVLRDLEKAYGRSGIPVLLLESLYVPRIEAEANRVLDVWGVPFSVELRTQRELKTADRLKDTLDVVVHSPGGVRSFRTYSGGERDRVSTALRIALARVIQSARGHSLGVFALDELAHLDAAGTEKLAELLRELSREIACVLFITHDTELSDAFDQRVVVVRENGRSRLAEAA